MNEDHTSETGIGFLIVSYVLMFQRFIFWFWFEGRVFIEKLIVGIPCFVYGDSFVIYHSSHSEGDHCPLRLSGLSAANTSFDVIPQSPHLISPFTQ